MGEPVSNATRTLEISQPWRDLSEQPTSLSDCVRYLRSVSYGQPAPHQPYAQQRCTDAAALMFVRHPEYFA